ncbi:hypothetical protein OJAV_G00125040 [Oryzias javanicus]|uniref:Uncharacterized protein n=1 Tax=Oryzias javanicus TaxID=123683 RepID=A0A437CNJ1_ORYJA|nr:hypothetical protein OJAV_G00125040 [Oryzias javanicus]
MARENVLGLGTVRLEIGLYGTMDQRGYKPGKDQQWVTAGLLKTDMTVRHAQLGLPLCCKSCSAPSTTEGVHELETDPEALASAMRLCRRGRAHGEESLFESTGMHCTVKLLDIIERRGLSRSYTCSCSTSASTNNSQDGHTSSCTKKKEVSSSVCSTKSILYPPFM